MKDALTVKKENLRELRNIVENSLGAEEVLVVTNEGDGKIVQQALEKIKKGIFRKDAKVDIVTHEEVGRRGQWLGLLDAYKAKKNRSGPFNENSVSIGGMYPGKGTRLSPVTQRLYGIKPFFPMLIRENEKSDWLSGAAASLFTCNHLAYHLKRMGFRGMIWKWGDEPQIAATRLRELNLDLSDVDFIRFGSAIKITENLAINKEWLKTDRDNNLVVQIRRRPRKDLIERLGIDDRPETEAMVHIGSPAFSYVFIEEALKIFGTWQGWVDVDGYLCDALTLDEWGWEEELKRKAEDEDLRVLLREHPDFYTSCQKLKNNIRERRKKGPLKIKVIDFGAELYWGDIGQLGKARHSLHLVAQRTPEGEFARELAVIDGIRPDSFGNIASGSCSYPKDGSVKNSVLINTRLYGKVKIDNAVLVNCDLKNARIMEGSVAYDTAAINVNMGKNAFSFKSICESLDISEDGLHTSIPRDPADPGKGLEDWNADSRQNTGSDENYKYERFGNPRSFEDEQAVMRQRRIPPSRIENDINEKIRGPLIERIRRNEEHG